MTRKTKEPREIILECCEGSRQSDCFKNFSDEAFIGYQTAMVKAMNPNIQASMPEVKALITEMVANNDL